MVNLGKLARKVGDAFIVYEMKSIESSNKFYKFSKTHFPASM